MMTRKKITNGLTLAVVGMVVALAGTATATPLALTNADFAADSHGDTNPTARYTVGGGDFYIWDISSAPADRPLFALKASGVETNYIEQSFLTTGVGSATAETYGTFTVTMDVGTRSNSPDPAAANLIVDIWNVTDDVSLDSETYSIPITASAGDSGNIQFDLGYANAAQDTGDEIALRISTNSTKSNGSTTHWIDNVTVEAGGSSGTLIMVE